MEVRFERDGVAVQAAAGPDGRVTMLDVSAADGEIKIHVQPTMFDGRTCWAINGSQGESTLSTFTAAWERLYEAVHAGRTYRLRRAVAEVVDAKGKVTAPGTGFSAAVAKCKATLSDFEKCYMTAEVVELLRELLAEQGYSTVPDINRIKKLGSRARDCFAYHEIVGTIFDRMNKLEHGVGIEEMEMVTSFFHSFNEFLES